MDCTEGSRAQGRVAWAGFLMILLVALGEGLNSNTTRISMVTLTGCGICCLCCLLGRRRVSQED
jgi:hypothetical protein